MADSNSNYNTNNIKPMQISQIEKEKSTQKLAEKIDKGLNIHSMPSGFKSGKFDYSVHPNDINQVQKSKSGAKQPKHKKAGVFIILGGVIVLAGLAYVAYAFLLNNPVNNNDQLTQTNTPIQQTNTTPNTPEVIVADNTPQEVKPIEATSTEEIATSTDEIIDETDTATTTEMMFVKDGDNDGLTDLEENMLGSNASLADSDSDGYNDADEVLGLYNPAGRDKLIDNPGIEVYENSNYFYSLIYPKPWEVQVVDSGNSVMFMNENEGFFQVSSEPNVENLNIRDWYVKEFSLAALPDNQYYSDDERELVFSPDGFIIYLTDSNQQRIYTLSYVSLYSEPAYMHLFNAMIQSFKMLK